jgi:hypothetical protein
VIRLRSSLRKSAGIEATRSDRRSVARARGLLIEVRGEILAGLHLMAIVAPAVTGAPVVPK